MKQIVYMLLGVIMAGMFSCSNHKAGITTQTELPYATYENELFSINFPKDWICDSSGWKGLDSLQNEVDILDPDGGIMYIHIVKTLMPFKWKNIDEAKQMAMMAHTLHGPDSDLISEIDSVEVGGYPTSILFFANYLDNDTIIQKQFVTYLQDSHIVVYFNEVFHVWNWDEAQELGDAVIATIKLKKVENPLENDSLLRNVLKQLGGQQGKKENE